MSRKIYLASSWRNENQPKVLAMLRELGHEVYDFRNPAPDNHGFGWKECGVDMYNINNYMLQINTNPISRKGFKFDRDALNWCDTCVLLLPCGRSAHLEAGYAIGQGKETFIVLDENGFEPELMYLLGHHICQSIKILEDALNFSQPRYSITHHDC